MKIRCEGSTLKKSCTKIGVRVTPEKEIPIEEALLRKRKGAFFYQRGNMANLPFTLHKLSADFYRDYDSATYPEIENKQDRPYMVMVVYIEGNTFALPFRTNIRHDSCYKFRNTGRNTQSQTDIDFSKAVIVNDSRYIGSPATIDNREYVELRNKYFFVIAKFRNYLRGYLNFRRNGGNAYVARKYRYSTLQYFDKELGLGQSV